ncbi:MAG: hypothetical protein FWG47_08255, partial [Propionibacteriaceae bacterium]|nr:hypothetical protein [Propionibacteriaceae bacterium]
METILVLTGLPLIFALFTFFARKQRAYGIIIRLAAIAIIPVTVFCIVAHYQNIFTIDLSSYTAIKPIMLVIDVLIAAYIIYKGIKHKSYLVSIFATAQIVILAWFELSEGHSTHSLVSLYVDKLSLIMIAIIGVIGSLICVYAVEYMRKYQRHHPEVKDRSSMFFTVLLVFLTAMFGLVISNDMVFILFFWEITSLCSFLLIGYSETTEAIKNAFSAITVNVFGGLCFTVGIV